LLFIFIQCTDNQTIGTVELNVLVKRSDLMVLSKDVQKYEYRKLSFENRKSLWIDKLNQVLTTSIPLNSKQLISNLILELGNANDEVEVLDNDKVRKISLELVEVFPQEDFLKVFSSLANYTPRHSEIFSDFNPCEFCKEDMVNSWTYDAKNSSNTAHRESEEKKECSCKWTCEDDGQTTCVSTDCKSTSRGCGFLWMQSCEEKQGLIDPTTGDCV
jgi:hypothetical protein